MKHWWAGHSCPACCNDRQECLSHHIAGRKALERPGAGVVSLFQTMYHPT